MSENEYDNRHVALWGEVGQSLIANSSLLIVGADRIGTECAKSAYLLGVGNILLMDDRNSDGEMFLDMPLEGPKATGLARLISRHLYDQSRKYDVRFEGVPFRPSFQMLLHAGYVSAVVDASNSVESQHACYEYCKALRIPLFTAAADEVRGNVSFYGPPGLPVYVPMEGDIEYSEPDASRLSIIINNFEGMKQGRIISKILANLVVDEFRKSVFLHNAESFKEVMVEERNGSLISYFQKSIQANKMLAQDVEYNINGLESRAVSGANPACSEGGLEGKRALVVGCGAIGCDLSDILARAGLSKIFLVDFDTFETSNLSRQPYAYGRMKDPKCRVVADRINRIANRHIAQPIQGFVGESGPGDVALLNKSWFVRNVGEFDIVFGCVDGLAPRVALSEYAASLKFKYVDGGSGGRQPNMSRAAIYVPGQTKCLKCSDQNIREYNPVKAKNRAESLAAKRLEARRARQRAASGSAVQIGNSTSCNAPWVEGSITMSNGIAAGMMAGAARIALNPQMGQLEEWIEYDGAWGSQFTRKKPDGACRCGG